MGRKVGGAAVEYFISRGRGHWFGRRGWKNGRDQKLPPGIWQRTRWAVGSAVKPVIMFVRVPTYKRYFDLEAVAQAALARDWDTQFQRTFAEAMRTAR